jgi:hypothetical protein
VELEAISSELLDTIEDYLEARVQLTADGDPNAAMKLLMTIQNERNPIDTAGTPVIDSIK